jgi:DNA-binding XRE family transcriptional regulator/tetratricopeptide (TPR) repeat protein
MVGYTQEQLAAVLDVERSTVVRWEAGDTTPQPWCRPKFAQALTVSADELDAMLAEGRPGEAGRLTSSSESQKSGELLDVDAAEEPLYDLEHDPVLSAPWNHRGTVEAAVVLGGGGRVKRRGFVFLSGMALTAPAHQWLIHEPGPLVSGLSGRRVSGELADRLPPMIAELRAMDDVAGGGTVFSLAQYEFDWVAGLLDQASYDESTGRKLHIALAELGQLCGWCGYDAGQAELAQRYYIAALHAAHSAADRSLGAHVLGSMAYLAAREGQPSEAVTLIDTAVVGARGQETASLLAQLFSRQAYALAIIGDASRCHVAISKARTEVERLNRDNDPPWLYWVSPAEITAGAGRCLQKLGQPDRAATLLDEGIALFDKSFIRDRTNYLIHLADALAQPSPQRDLDAAAEHGMSAIDLAESLDSARGHNRLRDLCHQLKPYFKIPAVADFLDRARVSTTV